MAELHPDEDLLLDLALSDIDQQQRDRLTEHLAACDPCRAEYAAIADSIDHVLAAAPLVAPPAGFSRSALLAMGMAGDEAGSVVRPGRRGQADNRGPRRRALLVALAAVLAMLLGVAGGAALMSARQEPAVQVAADGPALLTGDGSRVGTVLDAWYDGQPVLAVTLTAGTVGVRYDCQLILADGSRLPAGSWVLRQSSGTTWLLAHPKAKVTGLELVSDAGTTWATARL